jgi:cation:H+ antiporter
MSAQHPRHVVPLLAGLMVFSSGAALTVRQFAFEPGVAAALCFGAVIAAALLISWGAEAAQFYVSQGFAVAFIALLQVVPEFMVRRSSPGRRGRRARSTSCSRTPPGRTGSSPDSAGP